jgi:hypothetical protein
LDKSLTPKPIKRWKASPPTPKERGSLTPGPSPKERGVIRLEGAGGAFI